MRMPLGMETEMHHIAEVHWQSMNTANLHCQACKWQVCMPDVAAMSVLHSEVHSFWCGMHYLGPLRCLLTQWNYLQANRARQETKDKEEAAKKAKRAATAAKKKAAGEAGAKRTSLRRAKPMGSYKENALPIEPET